MKTIKEYISEAIVKGKLKQYNNSNYDYVDLDDAGIWATCNVGAKSPKEYGDYYAWGETKTKLEYTEDTYTYDYDKCTGKLNNSEDICYIKTNGKFRMPTKEELYNLINNTTQEEIVISSINCIKCISKKDHKKYILLPLSGFGQGRGIKSINKVIGLWSSTKNTINPTGMFGNPGRGLNGVTGIFPKDLGFNIRGILNK